MVVVGDTNTRFFHMTSMKHKAANRISGLVVNGALSELRKTSGRKQNVSFPFFSLLKIILMLKLKICSLTLSQRRLEKSRIGFSQLFLPMMK